MHVRLLDVPIQLIEKYGGTGKDGLLFPVPSNQKVNAYLKEIASVCGIDKDSTFHLARHYVFPLPLEINGLQKIVS